MLFPIIIRVADIKRKRLPSLHTSPVHPAVQLHVKPFTRSMHSPPLSHGLLSHSFISSYRIKATLPLWQHLKINLCSMNQTF